MKLHSNAIRISDNIALSSNRADGWFRNVPDPRTGEYLNYCTLVLPNSKEEVGRLVLRTAEKLTARDVTALLHQAGMEPQRADLTLEKGWRVPVRSAPVPSPTLAEEDDLGSAACNRPEKGEFVSQCSIQAGGNAPLLRMIRSTVPHTAADVRSALEAEGEQVQSVYSTRSGFVADCVSVGVTPDAFSPHTAEEDLLSEIESSKDIRQATLLLMENQAKAALGVQTVKVGLNLAGDELLVCFECDEVPSEPFTPNLASTARVAELVEATALDLRYSPRALHAAADARGIRTVSRLGASGEDLGVVRIHGATEKQAQALMREVARWDAWGGELTAGAVREIYVCEHLGARFVGDEVHPYMAFAWPDSDRIYFRSDTLFDELSHVFPHEVAHNLADLLRLSRGPCADQASRRSADRSWFGYLQSEHHSEDIADALPDLREAALEMRTHPPEESVLLGTSEEALEFRYLLKRIHGLELDPNMSALHAQQLVQTHFARTFRALDAIDAAS